MKFCMITTFFGHHSFGGDAAFVDRLSRALLHNGHQVDVIYSVDAFRVVQGRHPERKYIPPNECCVYPLKTGGGILDNLWTHQTGRMGKKYELLHEIWMQNQYDVIHFHNVSLLGAPQIFKKAAEETNALKLMTVSEHWLVCPLSSLWKFRRETCKKKRCFWCTLHAGRPPQLWRHSKRMVRSVNRFLDGLIFPSRHTLELHAGEGMVSRMFHLPYFLPDETAEEAPRETGESGRKQRPYFAAAGRFVTEKGMHKLIPLMRLFPDHALRIAGTGPREQKLRRMAGRLPNVTFTGLLDGSGINTLFRNAVAVIVPSLFYETFGYVALEAFSEGTPVIVNDVGALPELVEASGAGFRYDSVEELVRHMRVLATDPSLRNEMGRKGLACRRSIWSEKTHLKRYFSILNELSEF